MAQTSRIYNNPRPCLVVERVGGGKLGNCYHSMKYKVTSTRAMSMEDMCDLRKAGFLGYGQEFYAKYVKADGTKDAVPQTLDWKTTKDVVATGHDLIECSEVDDRTGEVLRTPSINPYSGKEDEPREVSYFVYECESRVDSSD